MYATESKQGSYFQFGILASFNDPYKGHSSEKKCWRKSGELLGYIMLHFHSVGVHYRAHPHYCSQLLSWKTVNW